MSRGRDNPRKHSGGRVTFSRAPGKVMEVWSYTWGTKGGREYHVAFVDKDGHTLVQGRFLVKRP